MIDSIIIRLPYPVIIDRLIQHFGHLNPTPLPEVIKAPVAKPPKL
ncbi:hypothetical protein [Candidatus Protochlamydia sp. R18]|nr:hypothetical protein [Candidatus Protochlamydia sp. R18]